MLFGAGMVGRNDNGSRNRYDYLRYKLFDQIYYPYCFLSRHFGINANNVMMNLEYENSYLPKYNL